MRLQNKIKEYRARMNLSQEELALRVNVRRETIGRLEMNKYNPSLILAMEIASIFGISVEELFELHPED